MADIAGLITSLLQIAGLVGVPVLVTYLALARRKLTQFRNFIVAVDDAALDNTVTEEEFQKIVKTGRELIS